ncbi:MAG: hypothetical protein IKL22_09510 [Lachnospiraceae bacterium]|nr:hypothetical protein [Lachnospiraceae bacterium]
MKQTKELAKEEVKELVAGQMQEIRQQVDDTVEEAVAYAMEKTERSLERISNEKIMAVSEYSDTVLAEIHKNHQEVMFLYDMLNDKHSNLKQTVTVVEKKAKEAEAMVKGAVETLTPTAPKSVEEKTKKTNDVKSKTTTSKSKKIAEKTPNNSNQAILELYKQGMDKVQIARELSMGVGEVELVIGLFKER